MPDGQEEQLANEWHDSKSLLMQSVLGTEHNVVMHAMIPFALGGSLDLYYYPNGVAGTGIATKECCESPDEGSSNEAFDLYELVMFTKHPLSLHDAHEKTTPFGKAHASINTILNVMASYSAQAVLNPGETCEFPTDMEVVGGKCLIFDAYGVESNSKQKFGLLAIIEVFRSEMTFARTEGGLRLLEKLKEAGHYPYSDLDREPVA